MAIYADRKGDSFPAIAETGANAVRLMWMADTSVPAADLGTIMDNAVENGLIPIPAWWDATGKWNQMSKIEAHMTSDAMVSVLKAHEQNMILEIANEAGTEVTDEDWVSTYTRIITTLREKDVHCLISVNAAGYGRNIEQLLKLAPSLLEADPDHNLIFDWHEYDGGDSQKDRITTSFDSAVSKGIALYVGEFASAGMPGCAENIPYLHLLAEAQRTGVGYLAWSWDDFNSDCESGGASIFNMVSDPMDFSTLRDGWAKNVCTSDENSIANTSVRPKSILTGSCGG